MFFTKNTSDILSMNARNLLYISRYNNRASKKFADDKVFTKQFLDSRGIGVAKLYHVVKNQRQLTYEFFNSLPENFVIKPNRGFAGGGILVITGRKGKNWITISGKKYDNEHLYHHCVDILEGKYSISGTSDDIVFEEMLMPHSDFRLLTQSGLPDVRVIVFNMVPVMAMLRVPTVESDGKANMELGAIALGIDIGTGISTGGAYHSAYIKKFPNGEKTAGFKIPYWDEILYSVSKIQQVTKIGFLGVDIVITKTGIKVLEVNARPGLKIQVANKIPLKKRLDTVKDLKIHTPEEGVEVAKTLFTEKSVYEESFIPKPLLGIKENVLLNRSEKQSLVAKISLMEEVNKIKPEYFSDKEKLLDITIGGKRLKLPVKSDENLKNCDLILSAKFLTDFYIDPNKKFIQKDLAIISTQSQEENMIKNIDARICEIDRHIKLLAYVNPRNIKEQKDLFFEHSGYTPRFSYRDLENLNLQTFKNDLSRIPVVDHELYPLYERKIKEIQSRISLLENRGGSDYTHFSEEVFGKVSRHIYQEALKFLKKNMPIEHDNSPILETKPAVEILRKFMDEKKLKHWNIKYLEEAVVDMQVTKKESVLVRKKSTYHKNRLEALLVHEIGTHVFRFENGKRQPLEIMAQGTANYLTTEEGLAVWNQNQLGLNLGDKYLTPALQIVTIHMAKRLGFRDLFEYLQSTFDVSDELAWKLCLKSKRGFVDSDSKGAFTKDAIYFIGNREIEKFVKRGGLIEELYLGKIAISELRIIKKMQNLRNPKFLI